MPIALPAGISPEETEAAQGPEQNPDMAVSRDTTKIVGRTNCGINMGPVQPGGLNTIEDNTSAMYFYTGASLSLDNKAPHSAAGAILQAPPNFKLDAAFIYLADSTNIDKCMGLNTKSAEAAGARGNVGNTAAVGIHGTAVRITSRDGGITMVTDTDACNEHAKDSSGTSGIILCAGNDMSGLQPMVKGDNLADALEALAVLVADSAGVTGVLSTEVGNLAEAVAEHTHLDFFTTLISLLVYKTHDKVGYRGQTPPSKKAAVMGTKVAGMITANSTPNAGSLNDKMQAWVAKYLENGKHSIKSRRNKVN